MRLPLRDAESPARPPRPRRLDGEDEAAFAARFGASVRDVAGFWLDPVGRPVIRTQDGVVTVDVREHPDAGGYPRSERDQGLRWHSEATGRRPAKAIRARCPEFKPCPGEPADAYEPDLSPWTVADLAYAAAKFMIPSDIQSNSDFAGWAGDDPVKAYRAWCEIAHRLGEPLGVVVGASPQARAVRDVIVRSGWLDRKTADAL
jgi:hypothetical protein